MLQPSTGLGLSLSDTSSDVCQISAAVPETADSHSSKTNTPRTENSSDAGWTSVFKEKNFLSVSSFLTNLIISMRVLDNTFMVWDSVSKKGRRDGRDKGRREGKKETYYLCVFFVNCSARVTRDEMSYRTDLMFIFFPRQRSKNHV